MSKREDFGTNENGDLVATVVFLDDGRYIVCPTLHVTVSRSASNPAVTPTPEDAT